jgi:CelD/BcsL family acetyltransferase involved in cellulose biosynthesis
MEFVCYSSWEQLPESTNELFAQARQNNLFSSRQWFECLAATALEAGESMTLACVEHDGRVLAMLPLMRCDGQTWYALRHGYTPLYGLLLADDSPAGVLDCLAGGLNRLPIQGLLLEPVADDDARLNALKASLEATGFRCDYHFRGYNWIHRLRTRTYAEYLTERPALLRNTISRKRRKLEREHGFQIRMFIGEQAAAAMTDYRAVFDASWKQNEFGNRALMDCIVTRFSAAGWSRCAILYVQGQPIAAQLWFVHADKAYIFRLAYDQAWRRYSPGSILTGYLMEHVIDTDGVRAIDFLSGNDAYKQDWMSHRRQRYLLSCVKRSRPANPYTRLVTRLARILVRR